MNKEQQLKNGIIGIGRKLYDLRLTVARGGNLSASLEKDVILITRSGACLGELREADILQANIFSGSDTKGLSTEFPLHSLIHKHFSDKVVIHCHPPLANAYFYAYNSLQSITFENKLFLGDVPVIGQSTPSVTQPEKVIAALNTNNIVMLRQHGAVCIGNNFTDAFYLVEELEEAVKMRVVARLLAKEKPDDVEKELKENLRKGGKQYAMFSPEHILAIVDLIKQDEQFLTRAKELNLTAQVAIKLDGGEGIYKFNFEQGRIAKVDNDDNAPFVISGPAEVWRLIFLGKLDPFVATTQGKLKLKGDLGALSRWYVPFSRMFALFKEVGILG